MGSQNLLLGALLVTLLGIGGLLVILSRLSRRTASPETSGPPPKPETRATILRVISTEKLDRHELKINLLVEVIPPAAASYQTETAWVIRVARIAGMQAGQSFPVTIGASDEVQPVVSWAKLWHPGYTPPPRA